MDLGYSTKKPVIYPHILCILQYSKQSSVYFLTQNSLTWLSNVFFVREGINLCE
jgi:hypothetical protein